MRYKFHILHVPGVKHKAADAMSRYPSGHKQPEMLELPDDIASLNVKHSFLSKIRQTDEADENGCIDRDIKESTVCLELLISSHMAEGKIHHIKRCRYESAPNCHY